MRVTSFSWPQLRAGQRRRRRAVVRQHRRRGRPLGDVLPGEEPADRRRRARRPRSRRTTRAPRRAPSSSTKLPSAAVRRSSAAGARASTRSGTFATALLPGAPWSTRTMVWPCRRDRAIAWIAASSPAARMRGFRSPATIAYAVVGGRALRRHLADAVDRFGRDRARRGAVDAAGRVVAHGAEEAAVELGLDAVERVARERRAGRRAAAALEQDEAAELRVARARPDRRPSG